MKSMIVPVKILDIQKISPINIDDEVFFVEEINSLKIEAFNKKGEIIGYLSNRSFNKINPHTRKSRIIGRIWSIFRNQLLIELEY